jgi:hypothetical protein
MRFFARGRRWERGGRPTLLNPAERVLEEVRRWVEGRRYERIEARRAAVEAVLRPVGSREKGLIAGRVAAYPSSFEYPALVIKNLCL